MALRYRRVDRDQAFLLPVDMRQWLPEDHLVWTVIDIVDSVETSAFHAGSRRGGTGRAGYDPDMLVVVLLYGYCTGQRSSRQLERLCHTDVAFRIACAQDAPDHTVLARFRQRHQDAFEDLFTKVLLIAAQHGLGQVTTVAIDGTKIAANASLDANRSEAWVRDLAHRIVEEADAVDAAEDEQFGPDRGDELPPQLRDPATRKATVQDWLAELDADRSTRRDVDDGGAAAAAYLQRLAAGDTRRSGRPAGVDPVAEAEIRLRWVVQRQEAAIHRWRQRKATAGNLSGRVPAPVDQAAKVVAARQRLAHAHARAAAGVAVQPGQGVTKRAGRVNLTDPASRVMKTRQGWVQGFNVQFAVSADQLITACQVSNQPGDGPHFISMMTAATQAADQIAAARGDHTTIGTVLADAGYLADANLTAEGPARLIALGKRPTTSDPTADPRVATLIAKSKPKQAMADQMATPQARQLYRRRGATVEPAIGTFKRLLDRFSRRGLHSAASEVHLTAAAFNLRKIHTARLAL